MTCKVVFYLYRLKMIPTQFLDVIPTTFLRDRLKLSYTKTRNQCSIPRCKHRKLKNRSSRSRQITFLSNYKVNFTVISISTVRHPEKSSFQTTKILVSVVALLVFLSLQLGNKSHCKKQYSTEDGSVLPQINQEDFNHTQD